MSAPRRRAPGRSAGSRPRRSSDDPQRLARGRRAVGVAHGELRVVGQHGARCRRRSRRTSPRSRCTSAARLGAGDPAAGAVGGGDPAVEGGGVPSRSTYGRASRHAGQPRPQRAGLGLGLLDAELDVDAGGAQPLGAAAGQLGSGSATATTTRATPAAISASAHGPVRPVCAHGSRVTTAVPPRARSPACGQRGDLGVRAAGRRGRALADERAVGGRAPPRRPAGSGWCVPQHASRPARARGPSPPARPRRAARVTRASPRAAWARSAGDRLRRGRRRRRRPSRRRRRRRRPRRPARSCRR